MVKSQLKGINKVKKQLSDGQISIYYYHRASGVRLSGTPNSTEFALSYANAESKARKRHKGTFSGLFHAYVVAPEFAKLAPRTQASYKRSLSKAEPQFGTMPLGALNDPRVKADFMTWRAEVAKLSGAREADNRVSAVSAMVTWGVDNGLVHTNHIRGFKRLYHSNRADLIWEQAHIEAFMAIAPIEMQRAMMLAVHTGLRQGDILHLAWSAYDGTHLNVRIRKNGRNGVLAKPTRIPCTEALRRMLDAMARTSPLILTTSRARAFKPRYFAHSWDKAFKAAGLAETGLHFHDLRGTAVTMLASARCTVPEIAAITGHKLESATKILEHYLARSSSLGDGAMARFENAPATKFANQMQTREREST